MSKYYKSIINNLNKPIERRTRIEGTNLGNEAIYNSDNQLLAKNSDDILSDGNYLVENISTKLELVLCGGGHIGFALYNIAQMLEWNVTIIEDREEYCNKDKYPKANLLIGNYQEEIDNLDLTNSAVIIATRGHKFDKSCLESALLKKKYRYLGMIGSKNKVASTKIAILEKINRNEINVSEEELNSIYSPIGLNINAQTPEEIAIAIIAEIIKATKNDRKQIVLEQKLLEKLANTDKPFVVARIIEKHGSAPREQGSFLAVFSDNSIQGTVGGGAVEYQVIEDCKKLLQSKNKSSQLFYHDLSNSKASKLGMICGGNVKILLTKFTS